MKEERRTMRNEIKSPGFVRCAAAALLALQPATASPAATRVAALPEVAEYCENQALTEWNKCNSECAGVFMTAVETRIGMACSRKCLERADAGIRSCQIHTTKQVRARFLDANPPDVRGYCQYICEQQRSQALSFRVPSVLAEDAYRSGVARCVAETPKRIADLRKGPPGSASEVAETAEPRSDASDAGEAPAR
jgi:hypothetical protein